MKSFTLLNSVTAVIMTLLIMACQPAKKEDSSQVANDKNDTAFNKGEEKDADFIVNTMAGNYAEIEMAELAVRKSSNTDINK